MERYDPEELEAGARAVYVAARRNITCDPWCDLPDWRKRRWIAAYLAAASVRDEYRRPARAVRLERAS